MNPRLEAAIHQVRSSHAGTSGNGANIPAPRSARSQAPFTFDWSAAVHAATPGRITALAAERGISTATLTWLKDHALIGWYRDHIAFPLHNQKGESIGCHVKADHHWFWHKPEGAPIAPLILGNLTEAAYIIACESQWDAIAVADRLGGFEAGAAFICTRGAGNGAMLGCIRFPPRARLILLPQSDPPNSSGKIPSEEWFKAASQSLTKSIIYRATVPPPHKDANDWIKAGATSQQVADCIARAQNTTLAAMRVRSIVDCYEQPIDTSTTLLGNRYLCREGSMLFIGPSGVGKSSASVQQDICWGLGMEAFGIKPAHPLKILTIQAENDDGDMTEMSRGIIDGLNLNRTQRELLRRQVIYATVKTKTGSEFIREVLAPLLDHYRPDLVRIDPLQSYLGEDFREARALLEFCQNGLNPLLEQYQCGCILNHHTPKTSNRDTEKWKASDWMYAGAGSAHLTNWARAVLVVDTTKVSGLFRFIAAKRGSRLGWEEGIQRYFAHSRESGRIVWEEPDIVDVLEAEDPNKESSFSKASNKDNQGVSTAAPRTPPPDRIPALLKLLHGKPPMSFIAWKDAAKAELHISHSTFYRMQKDLHARGFIISQDKAWTLTPAGIVHITGD